MHYCRRTLGCLHEVWLQGILQQYGDRALNAHVAHVERLVLVIEAQQDVADAPLQVVDVLGKAHYAHYLRRGRNVETCLRWYAVGERTETCYYLPERPVVHVEHPLPEYCLQAEPVFGVLVEIVVEQGRNHVVCRCYGMEVTREV